MQGVPVNEFHDNHVPVAVDRFGDRKLVVMETRHECKLLGGCYPAQVQPVGYIALQVVVPLVLDRPERCATQSGGRK